MDFFKRKDVFILMSGGFDSTALFLYFYLRGWHVHPYKVRYNSKQISVETQHLNQILDYFAGNSMVYPLEYINADIENTSSLNPKSETPVEEGAYNEFESVSTVVPGRNLIFMSLLANRAEAFAIKYPEYDVCISSGVHKSDWNMYPDCRPDFCNSAIITILKGTDNRVNVKFPFMFCTKDKILQKVSDDGEIAMPPHIAHLLFKSYSCYNGGALHCGKCPTCIERHEAFIKSMGYDLTEYETEPKLPK